MATNETLTFRPREFKGSRLRCLLLTHQQKAPVAEFFTSLAPSGTVVTTTDTWAPRGFLHPDEAKLGKAPGFLTDVQREVLTNWWLAKPGRANTPNWDLICTACIQNHQGLILVEAKAHENELADDRCGATNQDNLHQIEGALAKATTGWNELQPGFSLSATSHYQMSNRFAFAWKLAEMGVPVVLVYLGFLNAWEMGGCGCVLFERHVQWRECVVKESNGVIPKDAWDKTFKMAGTTLTVCIRSAEVRIDATVTSDGAMP